jgi:hypothetical protein
MLLLNKGIMNAFPFVMTVIIYQNFATVSIENRRAAAAPPCRRAPSLTDCRSVKGAHRGVRGVLLLHARPGGGHQAQSQRNGLSDGVHAPSFARRGLRQPDGPGWLADSSYPW